MEQDGEIPAVFRTGMLQTDTASDVSKVDLDDVDKKRDHDGETSMDSKMGDTPANYDQANQRIEKVQEEQPRDDEPDEDDNNEHMGP